MSESWELKTVDFILREEALDDNNFTACPNCGAICGTPDWKGHTVYLWANQYGWEKRLFCRECGFVCDFKKGEITRVVRWSK